MKMEMTGEGTGPTTERESPGFEFSRQGKEILIGQLMRMQQIVSTLLKGKY